MSRKGGRRLAGGFAEWGLLALFVWPGAMSVARAAISHEIEGRVQVGGVYDSNVLEELSQARADQALQLFGAVDYRLHPSSRLDLRSALRVGLHRYREIDDDSRVIGEGLVSAGYHVRNTAIGGVLEVQGRDYADSTASRGYGLVKAGAFLRTDIGGLGMEINATKTELNYRVTPGAEQVGSRIDATLQRAVTNDLLVRLQMGSGSFDFNRPQVRLDGTSLVSTEFSRKDEFGRAALEAVYVRRVYLSLGYTYLTNDSNSFGSSFYYHRFDASFRSRVGDTQTSVGVIARGEFRTYREDLSDYSVINFDSEREDNNGVTFEVGRSILPDTSAKLRLGLHHNESIFRDRLYDKLVAETHLEWRF
jgi:hypothetical protein